MHEVTSVTQEVRKGVLVTQGVTLKNGHPCLASSIINFAAGKITLPITFQKKPVILNRIVSCWS